MKHRVDCRMQVILGTNPSAGCHHFQPGPRSPSQRWKPSTSDQYRIILLLL